MGYLEEFKLIGILLDILSGGIYRIRWIKLQILGWNL
jgi:hypothetical protein